MRRRLHEALDKCLESILVEGKGIDDCLEYYPDLRTELLPLLETALLLEASPFRAEASARARIRANVLQAARSQAARSKLFGAPKSSSLRLPNLRIMTKPAVAGTIILSLLGGSTAVAQGSLPGSPLYPLKLVSERAWLSVTPGSVNRANLQLRFAEKRLLEAKRLAATGQVERVQQAILLSQQHISQAEKEAAGNPAASHKLKKYTILINEQGVRILLSERQNKPDTRSWKMPDEHGMEFSVHPGGTMPENAKGNKGIGNGPAVRPSVEHTTTPSRGNRAVTVQPTTLPPKTSVPLGGLRTPTTLAPPPLSNLGGKIALQTSPTKKALTVPNKSTTTTPTTLRKKKAVKRLPMRVPRLGRFLAMGLGKSMEATPTLEETATAAPKQVLKRWRML